MPEKHKQIVDLYEAGNSMSQVAAATKTSMSTVHRILKKYDVKSRPQGQGITMEQRAEVVSMYTSGMTPTEIFRNTDVSYKTVLSIVKEESHYSSPPKKY
jgi:DNA invertase Pin-like site-specific DNA recombinase